MTLHEAHDGRFALVTAAHHFLLAAVPLRNPHSRVALLAFVHELERCTRPLLEVDAILLRCLSVLDDSVVAGPSLVTHYLAERVDLRDCVARFQRTVEDLLRFSGIGDARVRQAIALIEERCHDPQLRQQTVAASAGMAAPEFAAKFKNWTGVTFGEYLRGLRLHRAASLLISSRKSIKEIWTAVGYNHPSNFDHDFKRRFHVTPSAYRARAIGSAPSLPAPAARRDASAPEGKTFLIVDDDEGTRETIGRYLQFEGYRVVLASTGREALHEAARVSPSAILLDYHLPDIDGLTCLRTLRQDATVNDASVVLFTADWDLQITDRELKELGAKLASKLCDLEEVRDLLANP
jgi:AraC-like DNA-binding protein/CheY-like chemotaxis protein